MAAFGIPGGAEWLVIALVVLLTFVPAVAVFLGGYFVGKARGRVESAGKPGIRTAAPMSEAPAADPDAVATPSATPPATPPTSEEASDD